MVTPAFLGRGVGVGGGCSSIHYRYMSIDVQLAYLLTLPHILFRFLSCPMLSRSKLVVWGVPAAYLLHILAIDVMRNHRDRQCEGF